MSADRNAVADVVVCEAACEVSDPDGDALGRVMGREPSPELAVMIVDECRRLLGSLRDGTPCAGSPC